MTGQNLLHTLNNQGSPSTSSTRRSERRFSSPEGCRRRRTTKNVSTDNVGTSKTMIIIMMMMMMMMMMTMTMMMLLLLSLLLLFVKPILTVRVFLLLRLKPSDLKHLLSWKTICQISMFGEGKFPCYKMR